MRWLGIIGILLSLQAQALRAPSNNLSRIHLTFLNCTDGSQTADDPELYVVDATTFQHVENRAQYTIRQTSLGFDLEIGLPPGFYSLGLIVGKCSNEILLPVLKGRDQDALLIGWKGVMLRESVGMVAGTVPFTGYTASIVYRPQDQADGVGPKSLVEDPARVQGDSYYATGLPAGNARLRISNTDGTYWLEFKIGMISRTPTQRDQVFNVSERDIQNAMKQKLKVPIITPP